MKGMDVVKTTGPYVDILYIISGPKSNSLYKVENEYMENINKDGHILPLVSNIINDNVGRNITVNDR